MGRRRSPCSARSPASAFLALQLFEVPTHPVPELVGTDEAAARAQTAGLRLGHRGRATSAATSTRTPGEIIRTSPAAGEELAEDEPFLIVVSDGPEFRVLAGPRRAARWPRPRPSWPSSSSSPCPPIEQPHEDVAVGSVISWSVPDDPALGAGGEVLPGTEVQLVVSTGPAPRTVPTLVGTTVEQATAALQAIQLGVTVAEPVFSDDIPTGSVVSANPPDGTGGIARGIDRHDHAVEGRRPRDVPDLAGSDLQQARETLAAAGLQLGSLLGNTQGLFVQATVQGQPAPAGSQYKRGTAVDIVFF